MDRDVAGTTDPGGARGVVKSTQAKLKSASRRGKVSGEAPVEAIAEEQQDEDAAREQRETHVPIRSSLAFGSPRSSLMRR